MINCFFAVSDGTNSDFFGLLLISNAAIFVAPRSEILAPDIISSKAPWTCKKSCVTLSSRRSALDKLIKLRPSGAENSLICPS